MSHLHSNTEGEKCRILSPFGRRGKSIYTSVGRQVISTKVACLYWHQVTSSFLGTVDGTSVFTEENATSKSLWLIGLYCGICDLGCAVTASKPCFFYIPCLIHGNPKAATFLSVTWFQHLSGSLRLWKEIFFLLWLIPPLPPMTFVLQCLLCCRLPYRTDLNTKPYNLISYEDVAQLIWLKKEERGDGLFPLVFFYLIKYISWINRFFSIAIPHKSGKWVMDFSITTFIILDLISIRVEKKCFSVYNNDPGIFTELPLHCWWGASIRFADLKHFKVAKRTWHQERGGNLSDCIL